MLYEDLPLLAILDSALSQKSTRNMSQVKNLSEKAGDGHAATKHSSAKAESVEAGSSIGSIDTDSPGVRDRLERFIQAHIYDPNFDSRPLAQARLLLDGKVPNTISAESLLATLEADERLSVNDSPYAEVRAVVSSTDPGGPVNTFRVWFLGTVFAILGTGINEFFGSRYPGIYVTASIAQLLSYPCGLGMAKYLPNARFTMAGRSFSLNPGPFNQKEHMLIAVMANVAFSNGTAYVTTIFTMLKLDLFYGEKDLANSVGFRILLTLSTQLLGFGCAGIARRFLVYPSIMIWPGSLVQIALNRALHNDNGNTSVKGWQMSRQKFLTVCFIAMFVYFWLPGHIFQALSFFNWITWISPSDVKLAIVTGSFCGLGLNPLPTFDWNIVSSLVDPIVNPFFSTANTTIGFAIASFFVLPLVYWYNIFNTAFFPINTNFPFDNTGSMYNVSRVLTPDYKLDVSNYEAYSAPYIGAGYAIAFAISFAAVPAAVSHVLLYHLRELKAGLSGIWRAKSTGSNDEDIHNRLMNAYPEVPEWWYLLILAVSVCFGIVICTAYPTDLPVWTVFLALALCLTLVLPTGIVAAVANVDTPLNVLSEFISGYAIPNRAIANMIFKAYGVMGTWQALTFSEDLKLGHYLKIPPRTMFAAQLYANVLASFVAVGVNAWSMANIPNFCAPDQKDSFTCPGAYSFFTSSIIWGVVGPKRLFGSLGIYNPLVWGFLVGALLPVPFWLLTRRYPHSFVRYVHVPALLLCGNFLAPYNFSFIWPACVVGFVFNFYVRRRWLGWWQKYAYVMSSGFRLAIAVAAIVIFLAVQLHDAPVKWWGNSVSFAGVDGGALEQPQCVLRVLGEGETLPGT